MNDQHLSIKIYLFPVITVFQVLLILCSLQVQAASARVINQSNPNFKLELLAQGLGVPWAMAFLNDRELIFTERQGNIRILDLKSLEIITLRGAVEVDSKGQGGMLDVATGPDYTTRGWLYFTYSKSTFSGAVTTLARARRRGNQLSDWQELLVTDSATSGYRHFGSRIAFDQQGHVFFGVGDRGERDSAQDLSSHAGTIMRLRLDGSIPDNNPFLSRVNALPEIWSYGHRNPQGLLYDHSSGNLWSIEHGPRGGDEINLVVKGANYGWPVISYGKEYWGPVSIGEGTEKPGMEQPVKVYIPSIAPGSLLLYSATAFPQWQGNLFSGALKLRHLNRVSISVDNKAIAEERLLGDLNERIRALAQSPEGWIYFSTDSGKIMRLRPRE
ncbi:MAG: PQQ-dependent sugar dehydrogenase [Gammaproteobacteria bacterium]|nr:PQQ-dependent sugar dehydrogenase [Gammaproteobacteria bacterium]